MPNKHPNDVFKIYHSLDIFLYILYISIHIGMQYKNLMHFHLNTIVTTIPTERAATISSMIPSINMAIRDDVRNSVDCNSPTHAPNAVTYHEVKIIKHNEIVYARIYLNLIYLVYLFNYLSKST